MVRLKVKERFLEGLEIQFQFHDGTIKSDRSLMSKSDDDISIPRWYD